MSELTASYRNLFLLTSPPNVESRVDCSRIGVDSFLVDDIVKYLP